MAVSASRPVYSVSSVLGFTLFFYLLVITYYFIYASLTVVRGVYCDRPCRGIVGRLAVGWSCSWTVAKWCIGRL